MTNAQAIARKVALSILKAYHAEIKSGGYGHSSSVEREKAQSAAFAESETQVRKIIYESGCLCEDPYWLDEKSPEES